MSTPRVELIMQNIATTLATVTTANGYNQDLTVTRPTMAGAKVSQATDSAQLTLNEVAPNESSPDGKQDWDADVSVLCKKVIADSSTDNIDSLLQTIASDVIKVLCVDRSRNSLAIRTYIDGATHNRDAAGASESITVNVRVWYRTDDDNPFSA